MLFSSYQFIFFFFPVVLTGYSLLTYFTSGRSPIIWLMLSSFFFYGFWNLSFLILLFSSIGVNYLFARHISQAEKKKGVLVAGICFNVALLAYFKYANFFVGQLNLLLSEPFSWSPVILPLAISFFTFQQIAYLSDVAKGRAEVYGLLEYALFVSFFPQLIAGPIVHHAEMMPQFKRSSTRVSGDVLALGFTWFTMGLFKKLVVADIVAEWVNPFFEEISKGNPASFIEVWGGVMGYTSQIYYDFSGYSDMAIGAALMLGIRLPLNFNSPYKSRSVAEYWRRWHMTLGRWLKEYLYIPLGGSRCSRARQYTNLMLVLLIAGLWHGAGWNYIFWGAVHGVFLCVNHAWRMGWGSRLPKLRIMNAVYLLFTLMCVAVARVFFRCPDLTTAMHTLKAMAGGFGCSLPIALENSPVAGLGSLGIRFDGLGLMAGLALPVIGLTLLVAIFAPNSQEILGQTSEASKFSFRWRWQPNRRWAIVTALMFVIALLRLGHITEFIYYRF